MAKSPINDTTAEALQLAAELCGDARFASLGVLEPGTGSPLVSRVAMLWHEGAALLLVSDLTQHAQAMKTDPRVSLLIGEPGAKGDPLTHPRITVQGRGEAADKAALRETWLAAHPKSKLYFDFADFRMLRVVPDIAYLNGGFGKAFHLTPADLPS